MRSANRVLLFGASVLLLSLSACGGKKGSGQGAGSILVDAGQDRSTRLGSMVELDGAAPAATSPRFLWEVATRPVGSEAEITDAESALASFVPDVAGGYEIRLAVWDGKKEGRGSFSLFVLPNRAPVASAGEDLVASIGSQVELDGTASMDPDEDAISMTWTFLERPEGSSAAFGNPSSKTPRFVADVPGAYEVELLVSDGVWEARDTVRIRGNRSPIADAGGDQQLSIGDEVQLDGSGSWDPDEDPLVHEWTLISKPVASDAVLVDGTAALARFTPDLEGTYTLELRVSDGHEEARDRVGVVITAPGGFLGSIVHVSPDGDDEGVGSRDSPLATLGAGIAKAGGNQSIRRIQLSPGVYDEPFGYSIASSLDVAGPDGEDEVALLRGAGPLFKVSGGARFTLSRVNLQTDDVAVYSRDHESAVSLTKVTCRALVCVESGREEDQTYGGTVTIRDSELVGSENRGSGVAATFGKNLLVVDSSIRGFGNAINVWDTSVMLSASDITENGQGVVVYEVDDVLVEGCLFEDNGRGVVVSKSTGVTIRDTTIAAGGLGVDVHRGGVLLQNVLVSNSNGHGLVIRGTASSTETVTLRGSTFSSIAGHGISIEGKGSFLDLGTRGTPGGNSIDSHGWPILDARPSGATGIVSMSETRLGRNALRPAPGTYTGPYIYTGDLFRIQTSGNKVFVH